MIYLNFNLVHQINSDFDAAPFGSRSELDDILILIRVKINYTKLKQKLLAINQKLEIPTLSKTIK